MDESKTAAMFVDELVEIPLEGLRLEADLKLPNQDGAVVLFAHGSGSGRHSPRNRQVAEVLQQAGLGTVLVDLLTGDEEQTDMVTRELRFNIPLLAGRLAGIIDWLASQPATSARPLGLFGASTGAAAALIAAAERPAVVRAVVSRGGRPDLAAVALRRVTAPTVLIVGERDVQVIELNRQALEQLRGTKRLEIVPGASHLFEEPGALERVSALARDWFRHHLGTAPAAPLSS